MLKLFLFLFQILNTNSRKRSLKLKIIPSPETNLNFHKSEEETNKYISDKLSEIFRENYLKYYSKIYDQNEFLVLNFEDEFVLLNFKIFIFDFIFYFDLKYVYELLINLPNDVLINESSDLIDTKDLMDTDEVINTVDIIDTDNVINTGNVPVKENIFDLIESDPNTFIHFYTKFIAVKQTNFSQSDTLTLFNTYINIKSQELKEILSQPIKTYQFKLAEKLNLSTIEEKLFLLKYLIINYLTHRNFKILTILLPELLFLIQVIKTHNSISDLQNVLIGLCLIGLKLSFNEQKVKKEIYDLRIKKEKSVYESVFISKLIMEMRVYLCILYVCTNLPIKFVKHNLLILFINFVRLNNLEELDDLSLDEVLLSNFMLPHNYSLEMEVDFYYVFGENKLFPEYKSFRLNYLPNFLRKSETKKVFNDLVLPFYDQFNFLSNKNDSETFLDRESFIDELNLEIFNQLEKYFKKNK
ncbi:hypothetical protein TUBRATIS_22520 [Tubulinosema ratisbonensis]|uniref:Uncharacterized protein n=1 Tax=Tubulinosema ratisbonensis TaxID=291195 RepID=A0A437AJE7_9MICR|nr:hypothetical protein TUBRATIS_22520 [Tubulinosema ratisbonensis]